MTEQQVSPKEGRQARSLPRLGPAIIMSGFLTKRTRTMKQWKKRWWQLLDDGTLLHFKNDDRIKLLGEVDIARSCYEVRLGAEHCSVGFPRAVPPCRCFAFSVLKRTYYMYAPTEAEAKRWTECITSVSAILNQKRLADKPVPPAPQVRQRRRNANSRDSRQRHSLAGPSQLWRSRDDPSELPMFTSKQPLPRQKRHGSVPNYLDQLMVQPPSVSAATPNAKLWLDGNPQPGSLSVSKGNNSSAAVWPSPSRRSHGSDLDPALKEPLFASIHGSLPRPIPKHPPLTASPLPIHVVLGKEFKKLQQREVEIRKKLSTMEPLQVESSHHHQASRPSSMISASPGKFSHSRLSATTLPTYTRLPMQRHGSSDVAIGPGSPPAVKSKPVLRVPKGTYIPGFVEATRIVSTNFLDSRRHMHARKLPAKEQVTLGDDQLSPGSARLSTSPEFQKSPPPSLVAPPPIPPKPTSSRRSATRSSHSPPLIVSTPPPPPSTLPPPSKPPAKSPPPSPQHTIQLQGGSQLPSASDSKNGTVAPPPSPECSPKQTTKLQDQNANDWTQNELQKVRETVVCS